MKEVLWCFLLSFFIYSPVFGESFLKAQTFPTTFEDLSFVARMDFKTEDYKLYEPEYDSNGVCIHGCAYQGITIKDDMKAVEEATTEMSSLVEDYDNGDNLAAYDDTETIEEQPSDSSDILTDQDWCKNGKTSKLPLRYPVDMSGFKYILTSDFGFRNSSTNGSRFHPAVDIGCPKGTPVYATADGVVEIVGNETKLGGAGRYINIRHDHGLITQYLHLESVSVSKGQTVKACQQIGISGNSGRNMHGGAYKAHLDYRIRFNSERNKFVDILCPCKATNRHSGNTSTSNLDVECAHSLFNAKYKFKKGAKNKTWRIQHNHCMTDKSSLLPDEAK